MLSQLTVALLAGRSEAIRKRWPTATTVST